MGFWNRLFGKSKSDNVADDVTAETQSFHLVNGGQPIFTTASGNIYENATIRATVHAFANHASKLRFKLSGQARPDLENRITFTPNPFMNLPGFLYRCATILSVNNTLFIFPLEDTSGRIVGYYPAAPEICEIVEHRGELYLRYTLHDGSVLAVEYDRVGIVSNFAYDSEFFGGDNAAIKPLKDLIDTQNQGLIHGIKNGASLRFLVKIQQALKDEALEKKRRAFARINLDVKNNHGVGIYDSTFEEVKQLKPEPFALNAAQAKLLDDGVSRYFGVPESIIKNQYSATDIEAFMAGKIAPFALKLSAAMTNMTFSERERACDNKIEFYANKSDYMSIKQKLDFAHGGVDRGIITLNEAREILGFPPLEDCDKLVRRLDYGMANETSKNEEDSENEDN